jgi:hypothetical protein
MSWPQDRSAAGRVRTAEESIYLTGNRNCDLPASGIVLESTLRTLRNNCMHSYMDRSVHTYIATYMLTYVHAYIIRHMTSVMFNFMRQMCVCVCVCV